MKKILGTLIVILISQIGFGQNYQLEFEKYYKIKDTINQLKTLKKWEAKKPNDAGLFVGYFNYYFTKSRHLKTIQTNGEKGSSNQKKTGFLRRKIYYNKTELQKGFDNIDKGIKLYPNRLDMRFGKIYVFGKIRDWKNFTAEIIKTIEHSVKNKNKWTWTNHEKYDGGEKEFLLDIQDYQLQLYNTRNKDLLKNMRQIANKVLEFYPNHIESLSNLSITYLLTGELDKGIEPLLRAEKINPKDYIVLGNIAQGYKMKGNKKKAIEYYKKVLKFGDKKTKEYAKQQIAKLNK